MAETLTTADVLRDFIEGHKGTFRTRDAYHAVTERLPAAGYNTVSGHLNKWVASGEIARVEDGVFERATDEYLDLNIDVPSPVLPVRPVASLTDNRIAAAVHNGLTYHRTNHAGVFLIVDTTPTRPAACPAPARTGNGWPLLAEVRRLGDGWRLLPVGGGAEPIDVESLIARFAPRDRVDAYAA